jgi:hypothetical protein
MPAYEVIVQIRKDGLDLAGFPYRRTIETVEGSDYNVVKKGGDAGGVYSAFPGLISTSALQFLVVSSDQAVNLIPGGVALKDGIIQLLAGGLLLLLNVTAAAAAGAQLEINNPGASPAFDANIKGAWGGA